MTDTITLTRADIEANADLDTYAKKILLAMLPVNPDVLVARELMAELNPTASADYLRYLSEGAYDDDKMVVALRKARGSGFAAGAASVGSVS